ncbi:hypothetical protein TNCV_3293762 [Trichonephila clavipes]|nr:hypothetical protein TNCV_3293762 [Trichonephila clavipes]
MEGESRSLKSYNHSCKEPQVSLKPWFVPTVTLEQWCSNCVPRNPGVPQGEKGGEEREKKEKRRERERSPALDREKGLSPRLEWKDDERRWR